MRVAFLGLGIMGRAMAANLVKAGHEVSVWNRSAGKEPEGARLAASPADAAQGAEIVWLCVSDTAAVEQVLFGANGVEQSLTTIIRSNYLFNESSTLYDHALKLWENLSQELNYNVMFSPRGVVIGTAAQRGIIHFYIADQKDADRDRAYWFEGVPAETALALATLREAASSYRAVAYADLTEVSVGVAKGGRSVDATDRHGRSWSTAIVPNDVPAVQAVLDRVDIKLGRRRPALAPAGANTVRWLTLALFVALAIGGELGIAFLPIVFVLVRPTLTAAVAVTAAMTIARLVVAARVILWADSVRQLALLVALSIAIAHALWPRGGVSYRLTTLVARRGIPHELRRARRRCVPVR